MKWRTLILLVILAFAGANTRAHDAETHILRWEELPDLPDVLGVAGAFSGVSGGALIVAGGANFPEPLFKNGQVNESAQKVWWDQVYVLASPDGQWQKAGVLPRPLAYGASVTTAEGLICIGGGNAERNYSAVCQLMWADGKIERRALPALPNPCSNTAAALLGTTIYVAGGQESPDAGKAMNNFWALDLSRDHPRWAQLEAWPGPGRILPVVAVQDGSFFLFSGCELLTDDSGNVRRKYLTDGYRFTPSKDKIVAGLWKRIADVPVPVVAAPTPAVSAGQTHILVFGGDHGRYAGRNLELMDRHPGFSTDILAYHTVTDTWTKIGTLPAGHVTTAAVKWGDRIVVPSGEIRPGTRSPRVLSGTFGQIRSGFSGADYITWGIYLTVILGVGLYFSKREKGTDDFFFGGKRVRWWAAGISIFGTQLSAITFMAIPAKVYATDWVYILAQAAIIIVAPIIVWFYLPFFRRLNIATAYEYLEKRFNVALRLFGGIAFCLMQLGRMGIVLFLPAVALATVTDFNVYTCILVMGIFCTIYTVLGGIEGGVALRCGHCSESGGRAHRNRGYRPPGRQVQRRESYLGLYRRRSLGRCNRQYLFQSCALFRRSDRDSAIPYDPNPEAGSACDLDQRRIDCAGGPDLLFPRHRSICLLQESTAESQSDSRYRCHSSLVCRPGAANRRGGRGPGSHICGGDVQP
jgi:N-acetylneuraminic acid mutarotase